MIEMEVLYRKYRPKRFSEVVGQRGVVETLRRAVEQGKVVHAYVFSGPRGTGKTSVARILAKAVNCPNTNSGEPCNDCEVCHSVDSGTFLDVIEVDAASNRGIDEIRRIRDQASYVPVQGKTKVYIVDEFHMLTREAFNALLKTLEEPPPNVLFVLATTNIERVPATVLSRCQIFAFRNLPESAISARLKEICAAENFKVTESALELLAKLAKGSLRDAISLLEQSVAYGGEVLDAREVRDALGLVPEEVMDGYVDALLGGDTDRVVEIAEKIESSGQNFETFLESILERCLERYKFTLDVRFLDVGRFAWNLSRQLKYANEKRSLFEAESLLRCQAARRSSISEKVKEEKPAPPLKEARETSKGEVQDEAVAETRESGLVEKVLRYLREEGDMSLYIALSMARVDVSDGEATIKVRKDHPFNLEILRKRQDEVKLAFAKFSEGPIEVSVEVDEQISDKKERENSSVNRHQLEELSEEERELAEKLLRLFPDRVRIEKTNGR
ncbi:MAG: DNA polymerase III subunit gamma/tau [Thermotogae bacterium]|nr:DNA polymerase III subunit gamma/tau [Thermotogota bacterium]RKX45815.1 MAG: DNA polymerase III subunit gamma/tau [Thermotogota bacterium]